MIRIIKTAKKDGAEELLRIDAIKEGRGFIVARFTYEIYDKQKECKKYDNEAYIGRSTYEAVLKATTNAKAYLKKQSYSTELAEEAWVDYFSNYM